MYKFKMCFSNIDNFLKLVIGGAVTISHAVFKTFYISHYPGICGPGRS